MARLARHFLCRLRAEGRATGDGDLAAAMQRMLDYDWPGNVRELENAIERACVLGSGEQIQQEDLPETLLDRTLTGTPRARACRPACWRRNARP